MRKIIKFQNPNPKAKIPSSNHIWDLEFGIFLPGLLNKESSFQ
jgi:hypothetical protein